MPSPELDAEKVRQLRLANDELEKRLLRVEDVEEVWTGWMAEFRTSLEAIPAQLAGRQKFTAQQMAAIRRALDGMKKDLEAYTKRTGRNAKRRKSARAKPGAVAKDARAIRNRPRVTGSRRDRKGNVKKGG